MFLIYYFIFHCLLDHHNEVDMNKEKCKRQKIFAGDEENNDKLGSCLSFPQKEKVKLSSPAEVNEAKSNSPLKVSELKLSSPAKINEVKSNPPPKLNEVKLSSLPKLNEIKLSSPAEVNQVNPNSPAEVNQVNGSLSVELKVKSKPSSSYNFNNVPDEIILHIFTFLYLNENFGSWRRVNKTYHKLLEDKIYRNKLLYFDRNNGHWSFFPGMDSIKIAPRPFVVGCYRHHGYLKDIMQSNYDYILRREKFSFLYFRFWFPQLRHIDLSSFSFYVGPNTLDYLTSCTTSGYIRHLNISNCYKLAIADGSAKYSAFKLVMFLASDLEELVMANLYGVDMIIGEIIQICVEMLPRLLKNTADLSQISFVSILTSHQASIATTHPTYPTSIATPHPTHPTSITIPSLTHPSPIISKINFPKLRKLDLSRNETLDWNLVYSLLSLFPNLTNINFSCVNLAGINFANLLCRKKLKSINVSGNDYLHSVDVMEGIIKLCPYLKNVNVSKSFCSDAVRGKSQVIVNDEHI